MLKKVRFILMFMSLSICLCLMSSTYSRYVASTTGSVNASVANWQVLVNDSDVTTNSSSTITFTPKIDENANVKADTVAPSSTGYFDIKIDPTNVDVSFKYTINLSIANQNTPDLMITKYAIIPSTYVEGDALDIINLSNNTITNTLSFNNSISNFKFNPFTVRVYFEWYEGSNESMDDDADTAAGKDAATNNTTFTMNASISFEQVIE